MRTSQVENKTVKGTGKGPSSKGQALPCWINHPCDMEKAISLQWPLGRQWKTYCFQIASVISGYECLCNCRCWPLGLVPVFGTCWPPNENCMLIE